MIVTEPAAHHYRFVGIEFGPARGTFLRDLVQLGLNHTDVDAVPHHIIFDRCYLHGDPQKGTRRGIAMNSGSTAVIDSYLSDFKEAGADSQAIAGWNGPGPFKIANNFLEAAGENVLFGGADPSIPISCRPTSRFVAITWPNRSDGARGAGTSRARSGPSRTSSS